MRSVKHEDKRILSFFGTCRENSFEDIHPVGGDFPLKAKLEERDDTSE